MSSSNQASELSMDDILASIRRIIAEEPGGKGKPVAKSTEPADAAAVDAAAQTPHERGGRSPLKQLSSRLNEVHDAAAGERRAPTFKDDMLELDAPRDLDEPYTARRRQEPPPIPSAPAAQPPADEGPHATGSAGEEPSDAATKAAYPSMSDKLRRQVWPQSQGTIHSRIGRLDPMPLTTALARTVGSAPSLAFDAFKRKSAAPAAAPAAPPAESRAATQPASPDAPPAPVPPAVPEAPASAPVRPPSVPAGEPVEPAPFDPALAGKLAASMRDLDATLGSAPKPRAPEPERPRAGALPPLKAKVEPGEKQKPLERSDKPERKEMQAPIARRKEPLAREGARPDPVAAKTPTAPETPEPSEALAARGSPAELPAPIAPAPAAQAPEPASAPAKPVVEPVATQPPAAPAAAVVAPAPAAPVVAPAAVAPAVPPAPAVRSLEDTVSDLLRPVLRQWLDDHMPRMMEKVLREELAARSEKTSKT